VDIVTWRGVLTHIMSTPFDQQNDWAMFGTLRNGVIYIEEERKVLDMSPRSRQCTYWGHKFENLCMVEHSVDPLAVEPLASRREKAVNTNEEFGIVVKVKLGEHRLVLGAEVDGIDESGSEYIELKTSKTKHNSHDERFFKEKLLKYWLQSYLVDVPNILVGFRDHKGWVKELETIHVAQIPRTVRGHVRWDPNAILLMGDQFFSWLKARVMADVALAEEGQKEISFRLRHAKNGGGVIEYKRSYELKADLPDWYKYY